MSTRRTRIDWADAKVLIIPRVVIACPYCLATSYEHVRSMPDFDDATAQRKRCRECGEGFVVLTHKPDPLDEDNADYGLGFSTETARRIAEVKKFAFAGQTDNPGLDNCGRDGNQSQRESHGNRRTH